MTSELIVSLVPGGPAGGEIDVHPYSPTLQVTRNDVRIGSVRVRLSGLAATIALGQMPTNQATTENLNRILNRYSVRRLEAALHAEDNFFAEEGVVRWDVEADEARALIADDAEKACAYQVRDGRDLMCSAAATDDPSAIGRIGLRLLAPTSKHQCRECDLPDEYYICSNLIHPQIDAQAMEESTGQRSVWKAVCDRGQPFVREPNRCHAGGHPCWQRVIHLLHSAPALPPLALIDELDFLDAAWQLLFGANYRLLDLATVSEPAGLAQTCTDRATFEVRISDLADIIDRFKVDEAFLPSEPPKEKLQGSLNRMELALKDRLAPDRVVPV